MTNELLAAQIGAGRRELLPELWANVWRFYRRQAARYAARYAGLLDRRGLTVEDLTQEGYFAMLDALRAYNGKQTDAAFLTFAGYHYKNRCYNLIGLRARRADALDRCAVYLDAPIDDSDGSELGELIEDTNAADAFQAVELSEIADALRDVLTDERERELITRHFYGGQTFPEIAAAMGLTVEDVNRLKERTYRRLRNCRRLQRYVWI